MDSVGEIRTEEGQRGKAAMIPVVVWRAYRGRYTCADPQWLFPKAEMSLCAVSITSSARCKILRRHETAHEGLGVGRTARRPNRRDLDEARRPSMEPDFSSSNKDIAESIYCAPTRSIERWRDAWMEKCTGETCTHEKSQNQEALFDIMVQQPRAKYPNKIPIAAYVRPEASGRGVQESFFLLVKRV
jgi:hypothetical protein